jgi:hypothetical protein
MYEIKRPDSSFDQPRQKGHPMNRREFLSKSTAMAAAASFPPASQANALPAAELPSRRIPIIDVTDLYQPFQDSGDNLDLVHAFTFPDVDLRAVILDVTDGFRLPVSTVPNMWQDRDGPREPGIVPVTQLNYIFDRQVPYAVGPFTAMRSADDRMLDVPAFQQTGIRLLLQTLEASEQPVEILSFGSTRAIAAAFNREPDLMRRKVARIHISAGTAEPRREPGSTSPEKPLSDREWNVSLDPWAFVRLLRSDLPIALYPCATHDGPFAYGANNTFWKFKDLGFVSRLDRRLRNYVLYALRRMTRPDFLACLDGDLPTEAASRLLNQPHNVWETAVWLNVARRKLIQRANGEYAIAYKDETPGAGREIRNALIPCEIQARDNGRFTFQPATGKSNFSIFERGDPAEYEAASREAFTALWLSLRAARA